MQHTEPPDILNEDVETALVVAALIGVIQLSVRLTNSITFFLFRDKVSNKEYPKDEKLTEAIQKIIKEEFTIRVVPRKGVGRTINAWTYGGKTAFYTIPLREMMTNDELIAILLHEYGHVKEKHADKNIRAYLADSFVFTAVLFGLAALAGNPALLIAANIVRAIFGIEIVQVIYTKLSSQKHEFIADSYAKKYGYAQAMISAFKKFEEMERRRFCKRAKSKEDCDMILEKMSKGSSHPSNRQRIERLGTKLMKTLNVTKNVTISKLVNVEKKFDKVFTSMMRNSKNLSSEEEL